MKLIINKKMVDSWECVSKGIGRDQDSMTQPLLMIPHSTPHTIKYLKLPLPSFPGSWSGGFSGKYS